MRADTQLNEKNMPFVSLKNKEDLLTKSISSLDEITSDLKIVCSDGIVRSQQAILSWSSSFLRRMFMSQMILEDGGKRKEEVSIYLSSYSKNLVKSFIMFISNGDLIQRASQTFAEEFEQLWGDLKIDKISFKEVFEAGQSLGKVTSLLNGKGSKEEKSSNSSKETKVEKGPPGPGSLTPISKFLGKATPKRSGSPLVASPAPTSRSARLQEKALGGKNQSSFLGSIPKFSSTPIRPVAEKMKKAGFKGNKLQTVSENLKENGSKNITVIEDDEDDLMVIDEVKGNNILPVDIKHELPAGISITKQVSITKNEDSVKVKDNQDNNKENTSNNPEEKIYQDKTEQIHANKNVKPSLKSKIARPKLKRADSLGRKAAEEKNLNKSSGSDIGRRQTRRSFSSVPTYNEDLIQKNIFDKKQPNNTKEAKTVPGPDLSESFQEKIVKGTKNLRIPLPKLKEDKLTAIQLKKDQAELARARVQNSPLQLPPNVELLKTPFKNESESAKKVGGNLEPSKAVDPELEPIPCYICKQTKDDKNRVLNLRNVNVLRSHVSICLYATGKLFKAIPPGKDNSTSDGKPLEEFGGNHGKKYYCEVEGCWLAARKGRNGQIGYKEYAIHMAAQHGALEMVLMEEGPEAEKLMERLMEHEGAKNTSLLKTEELPVATLSENVIVVKEEKKEVGQAADKLSRGEVKQIVRKAASNSSGAGVPLPHCFFCNEKLNTKELQKVKEHYTKCLYKDRKFTDFVPPGPENAGAEVDEVKLLYRCEIQGCWLQKKCATGQLVNYKIYAQHMASQHGVLEQLLQADPRPPLRTLLARLRELGPATPSHPTIQCRFPQCSGLQFKGDNKREIKLHYASHHFNDYFRYNPDTGVPDNFTRTGNRTLCDTCSKNAPKPVYIQSEKEAIRGHLVVKHDIMSDILMQAHGNQVTEAKMALKDIYPDYYNDKFGN